jgi:hypothetical protein
MEEGAAAPVHAATRQKRTMAKVTSGQRNRFIFIVISTEIKLLSSCTVSMLKDPLSPETNEIFCTALTTR